MDDPTLAALLAAGDRLGAVLRHRQTTGASLADAVAFVAERIAPPAGPPLVFEPAVTLLAFGPFRRSLVEHFEYPARAYADVAEGSPLADVMVVVETAEDIATLCGALGVGRTDFATVPIEDARVDLAALAASDDRAARAYAPLRAAGFVFLLRRAPG